MSPVAAPARPFLQPEAPAPRLSRRGRLVAVWSAVLLLPVCLVVVLADESATDHRQASTEAALGTTDRQVAAASRNLSSVRAALDASDAQVGSDTTALERDASELQNAERTLSGAAATVSEQSTRITALHTCVDGVERALNALAVDNEGDAVAALHAVTTSCAEADSGA